jgi:hypothetical protein
MRLRPLRYLPLVASALCAVFIAQMAARDPRYLVPFVLIALVTVGPAFVSRWRMKRLLMRGDPRQVLGTWEGSIERIMYPETMAPLMAATAYASYGWTDAARNALSRAVKGPAWDAALEQRLFVETLLDTFEGERDVAMRKAAALERMPIPATGPFTRKRITTLRRGLTALARAFAHESTEADARTLDRAASASPLVHWAMRYARAIILIDRGQALAVPALLAGAPEWPKESAFRVFHDELMAKCCPA